MTSPNSRLWIIRWMYAVAVVHLVVGILLPWVSDASLFGAYHRSIEAAFWGANAPAAARAQQLWWISLFGPTVQGLSIWMLALVRIGERHRSVFAWGALILGVLVWAPQDMLISLRADCWAHVWLDFFAVLTMLPPLVWLWLHDRKHLQAIQGSKLNTTSMAVS
jgi:hypothetical protein